MVVEIPNILVRFIQGFWEEHQVSLELIVIIYFKKFILKNHKKRKRSEFKIYFKVPQYKKPSRFLFK